MKFVSEFILQICQQEINLLKTHSISNVFNIIYRNVLQFNYPRLSYLYEG